MLPNIDLHVIHLIRDARGVVSSWQKSKNYLKPRSPLIIIIEWIIYNLEAELIGMKIENYIKINFEDLVKNPSNLMNELKILLTVKNNSFEEKPSNQHHALAGNPDKFKEKRKVDVNRSNWNLPLQINLITFIFCWPLLIRYGYKFRTKNEQNNK